MWLPYTEQGKNRLKNLPPHSTASQQPAIYLSAVRLGGLAAVPGKNDDPPAPTRLWGGLTQKGAVRGEGVLSERRHFCLGSKLEPV